MATNYPITAFHFKVEWGGASGAFTEVSGLNLEHQVVEYRDGLSKTYSTIKMPGLDTNGEITMKRGIFRKNKKNTDNLIRIKTICLIALFVCFTIFSIFVKTETSIEAL